MLLFKHKEFALEYAKIGNGKKTILYFHGYGKSLNEFYDYEFTNLTDFTIYSFNFFHHGNSVYPENKIHSNTPLIDIGLLFLHILSFSKIRRVKII